MNPTQNLLSQPHSFDNISLPLELNFDLDEPSQPEICDLTLNNEPHSSLSITNNFIDSELSAKSAQEQEMQKRTLKPVKNRFKLVSSEPKKNLKSIIQKLELQIHDLESSNKKLKAEKREFISVNHKINLENQTLKFAIQSAEIENQQALSIIQSLGSENQFLKYINEKTESENQALKSLNERLVSDVKTHKDSVKKYLDTLGNM